MLNIRVLLFMTFAISIAHASYAQIPQKDKVTITAVQTIHYTDHIYQPTIKTVQLYPKDKEGGFPIIHLNSDDQLLLTFDELENSIKTYSFGIQHCDAEWQPSNLTAMDYVSGYNEDAILNGRPSVGTLQAYTHYESVFPNVYIKPKIAGNYLLKVYEDQNKEKLVFTKRFYVLNPVAEVVATLNPSIYDTKDPKYQKIDVTCTTALAIPNPQRDLKIIVFQNQRPDYYQSVSTPSFIESNKYSFKHIQTLNFLAHNEFRFVDLRTLKGGSGHIINITSDSLKTVSLFTDNKNAGFHYTSSFDHNGNYYIRNLDYDQEEVTADYINVIFSLQTDAIVNGNIYIVGRFNDFSRQVSNKLIYDTQQGYWTTQQQLKQGLYDYEYILEDAEGKIHTDTFSGSYAATGNDYQIVVYLRKAGASWDELIAYKTISTHNKNINN